MLRTLSLLSMCCGLIAVSNTALAQLTEASSACKAGSCCTPSRARLGTTRAPSVGARLTPAHDLHASPSDTITIQELVRGLEDPTQRDALIDALQAQRMHVDLSQVKVIAEKAAGQAREATCQAQQALCQALSSANVAHCTALATAAVRDAEPAIASALKTLSALDATAHGAKHSGSAQVGNAGSAHAQHQDPDDPDEARDEQDNDEDEDMQEAEEADEMATIWETPEATERMETEMADELARAADEIGDLGQLSELGALAELGTLAEMGDARPAPAASDDQSLTDRVRALERAAHGGKDWAPPKGDDQRSLEERVTELEQLLRERDRGTPRGRSPAAPSPRLNVQTLPPGRYGVYGLAPGKAPGGTLWKSSPDGQWRFAPTPAPPAPGAPPAPPAAPAPGAFPSQPAPPAGAPDEPPPTVMRIPRGGGGSYGIYSTTPHPKFEVHVDPQSSKGFTYFSTTPEAKAKIERSLEKAQRSKEQAQREVERAQRSKEMAQREKERELRQHEGSSSLGQPGAAMGADARRQVEQLMQEMRGQMEAMREEMNHLRAELERMPRNESR